METKVVHRIALPSGGRSMWYDMEGNFSPINKTLEMMPMPFETDRHQLGESGVWLSSVEDINLLETWFPDGLLDELKRIGFVLHKYEIRQWVEKPNELVFNIETAREIFSE